MKTGTKLQKAIGRGEITVTILTGPDGRNCPNCPGGNAMICRGECPDGFEPHHFWEIGLDLQACRDCGHSVVAQKNRAWVNESIHAVFVQGVATGANCTVSNTLTNEEQAEEVHNLLATEIDAAVEAAAVEAAATETDMEVVTFPVHDGNEWSNEPPDYS